jgi:hypothetical protein
MIDVETLDAVVRAHAAFERLASQRRRREIVFLVLLLCWLGSWSDAPRRVREVLVVYASLLLLWLFAPTLLIHRTGCTL